MEKPIDLMDTNDGEGYFFPGVSGPILLEILTIHELGSKFLTSQCFIEWDFGLGTLHISWNDERPCFGKVRRQWKDECVKQASAHHSMCMFLFVLAAASSVVFVMFVANTLRLSIHDRCVSFGGCVAQSPDFLDINRFGQPTLHGCLIYMVDRWTPHFVGTHMTVESLATHSSDHALSFKIWREKTCTLSLYIYIYIYLLDPFPQNISEKGEFCSHLWVSHLACPSWLSPEETTPCLCPWSCRGTRTVS